MKFGISHLSLTLLLSPLSHQISPEAPLSIADRANQLLLQGFNPCNGNTISPRNCFETAAAVSGLDNFRTYREMGLLTFKFSNLLQDHRFQSITHFNPFFIASYPDGSTRPSAISTAVIPNTLHSGDILAFGDDTVPVHAVVYLGSGLVFEKTNYECGPRSPYQLMPLTRVLQRTLGKPYNEDTSYRDIFVFRRSP